MTTSTTPARLMSRWDAASMAVFMVIGAAFAVFTVVQSVLRIIEVLAGGDVRVFAQFAGTMADLAADDEVRRAYLSL